MSAQDQLEWVEPQGGCVCFPRVRRDRVVDMQRFHRDLLNDYGTYVGKGSWFETAERFLRIGYSWEPAEKLAEGLENILAALGRQQ